MVFQLAEPIVGPPMKGIDEERPSLLREAWTERAVSGSDFEATSDIVSNRNVLPKDV
jgi:hypothetical protein